MYIYVYIYCYECNNVFRLELKKERKKKKKKKKKKKRCAVMNEGSSPLRVTVCFIHNISYTATFHIHYKATKL